MGLNLSAATDKLYDLGQDNFFLILRFLICTVEPGVLPQNTLLDWRIKWGGARRVLEGGAPLGRSWEPPGGWGGEEASAEAPGSSCRHLPPHLPSGGLGRLCSDGQGCSSLGAPQRL